MLIFAYHFFQAHRRYLRFCVQGRAYQYRALAFGPKTPPRVFTKVVSVVAAHLRMQNIRLAVYLYDWLALNAIRRLLLQDRQKILNLLSQLGFLVNAEKSQLVPTQDITYIGGRFLLAKGIVLPTLDNVKNKGFCASDKIPIRHSKTVFTNARSDGFLHRGSTIYKTSYEADAIASTVLVEASVGRSRDANSRIATYSRPPELVVTGSKHAQGQISEKCKQDIEHRCLITRMGRNFRSSDCAWPLATRETNMAHKLFGVGSCFF